MYKSEFCSHKQSHPLKGNVPVMQLFSGPKTDITLHREKETSSDNAAIRHLLHYYANVSTDISRKTWQEGAHPDAPQWKKDARDAMLHEWDRLRGRETLINCKVKEFREIKSWAEKNNVHVHFGTLHDFCVEKYSEPPGDKRKYKGRVVFGGHDVRNSSWFTSIV